MELKDMSFDDLVREGVNLELDAVVQGESLRKRVWAVMDLAVRWAAGRKELREVALRELALAAREVAVNSNRGNDGVSAVPGPLITDLRDALKGVERFGL